MIVGRQLAGRLAGHEKTPPPPPFGPRISIYIPPHNFCGKTKTGNNFCHLIARLAKGYLLRLLLYFLEVAERFLKDLLKGLPSLW